MCARVGYQYSTWTFTCSLYGPFEWITTLTGARKVRDATGGGGSWITGLLHLLRAYGPSSAFTLRAHVLWRMRDRLVRFR